MAEPSERDRQRLEALQERLQLSREEKRAWTEERKELRARATAGDRASRRLERADEQLAKAEAELKAERARRAELERALAELERRVARLDKQQEALIGENRRQAEALQGLQAENEGLGNGTVQARNERAAAVAELEKATAGRRDLERRLKALEAESAKTAEALLTAREQLRAGDRPQILTADEVGSLVDRLIGRIAGSMPGLDVRDGAVTLKVAFAGAGEARGFVVPSVDAPEGATGPLHEIALRFERSSPA